MGTLRLLCVGDIVGSLGRYALSEHLRDIQREYKVQFTVVNLENAASGFGVTPKVYAELEALPVQAFTSGNHIFDKKESIGVIDSFSKLVRPVNFPPGNPGVGYRLFTFNTIKIAVVNAIGRVFMHPYDCPFQAMDRIWPDLAPASVVVVDFHAEATSEKMAMGWYLDGRASVVFGTHTHTMTADERILEKGTAFISDIGMTGSSEGVLGMERGPILHRFLTQMPAKFSPPKTGYCQLNAIVVDVDSDTGKALHIERVQKHFFKPG
ncbi:MAG: TIGR00282 family metallophosphoesterase [Candidatus Margulisiibacteriota bacterium]